MRIAPFEIEQFFARYEFSTPHLLCASDCETTSVAELLQLAGLDLSELGDLRLGYTESQGNPALRAHIANAYAPVDMRADQTAVTPDDVVVLGSPEEGIYLTLRALLSPGDPVVVLTPAYNSLLNLAEHVSGNVSQWEIRPVDGGWQLDVADLARLLRPTTKLIIVNFPHNPTGLLPTPEQFSHIVNLARQHGAWLFCDEMYRGLELNGQTQLPSAVTLYERGIVLAGLSKVHGLPGLRSGWLLVRDTATRDALINWKHYTSICAPAPSELLAQAALQVREQLAARSLAIISANLSLAAAFFRRWPQLFTWRPPQAGSVALVEIAAPSATAYCQQLAQTAGVLLLPGKAIGYRDTFVRWGFGRASFTAALAAYDAFLAQSGS